MPKDDFRSVPITRRRLSLNLSDHAEKLLKGIIVCAVVILASVIGINVFHFKDIPLTWRIGITTFILLLPFSLFLQASLNAEAVKDERHSKIQNRLRSAYVLSSRKHQDKTHIADQDIENEKNFRHLIEERSFFLTFDSELYSVYQQAYEIYLLHKKKHMHIKGVYDENDLKRCLLRFELNGILSVILKRMMKEEGTDFRAYLLPLSFFLFMYFAGFLIILPLINSIFTGIEITATIPLFKDNEGIPIVVIQWGFLGGLVYTSISLLNRFLRNDLVPSLL